MAFKFSRVQLGGIDFEDTTYRITTNRHFETLIPSIENLGLLHPPLLVEKHDGWRIVFGFNRLLALRAMGVSAEDVFLSDSTVSTLELAKKAILDNTLHRTLNLLESAKAYRLLCSKLNKDAERQMNPDEISEKLLITAVQAGCPNSLKNIRMIMRFCDFPSAIKTCIVNGTIGQSTAQMLLDMDEPLQNAFGNLFSALPLNMNKQREIITMVVECARRDRTDPISVLKEEEVDRILSHPQMGDSERAQMLRCYLKKRRYPHLTEWENRFSRLTHEMGNSSLFSLSSPPYFEGNTYTLTLQFRNETELRAHQLRIDELMKNPLFSFFMNAEGK